ncbi:hypothetical protein [Clavibacter phaseoli]|uniref:hypothetical protein n=1 Tax=Clavibacter phaseoli TaxID=1734031 RepID=UPI001F46DEA3|nr:hypothetical protein [Clavibacter phaseoli]UKF32496.1 hypothetical protein FGD69_15310 [Clavibacter phaseoli]UKF38483.1 hypothetical protein FGI33_15040 [Clavibacter phaseoli]
MSDRDSRARIAHQLLILEDIAEHAKSAIPTNLANPGYPLTLDDKALEPYHLSHVVANCLTNAADVLATARLVLDDDGALRVPIVGIYPLMRSALEASALAVWLLSPDDPRIRRSRALSVRWADMIYDDTNIRAVIGAYDEDTKEARSFKAEMLRKNARIVKRRKELLNKVADALDIEIVDRPGFGPIIGDTADFVGLPVGQLRGTYGILSGLTHPSLSGTLRMSTVNRPEKSEADGTLTVNISADLSTVAFAIDSAVVMYMKATAILGKRTGLREVAWPTKDTAMRVLPPD